MYIVETVRKDQTIVKFSNDLAFKYMLSRNHPASIKLLKRVIKLITGIDCKEVYVKNPQISPSHVHEKWIVLDVHAVNENNIQFDIELQMYGDDISEQKRFQYYGAKMITNQIKQGKNYAEIDKVYQCILTNLSNSDNELVDMFTSRNQNNKIEKENLNIRYFVYMKEIDKILKSKSIDELNDLERLCYLFINNSYDDIIKDDQEDIIRQVVTMYNEFKNDEEMWELGKQRELAKIREASFKTEYENKGISKGIKKGIKKGIEKGIEKGTLKTLISSCDLIIQNLYKVECTSWLHSLSKNQLEKLQEFAFKEKDFNSLKEKIESL